MCARVALPINREDETICGIATKGLIYKTTICTESLFVRCYFPEWSNTVKRLPSRHYPTDPQTIGEQLFKRRIDLRLLQKEVANLLGVTEDSITLWENGHSIPQIHYAPKIIRFLGFNPYFIEGTSLAVRIKNYRFKHGLSYKRTGSLLGVSSSTISSWEERKLIPNSLNKTIIEKLIKG